MRSHIRFLASLAAVLGFGYRPEPKPAAVSLGPISTGEGRCKFRIYPLSPSRYRRRKIRLAIQKRSRWRNRPAEKRQLFFNQGTVNRRGRDLAKVVAMFK